MAKPKRRQTITNTPAGAGGITPKSPSSTRGQRAGGTRYLAMERSQRNQSQAAEVVHALRSLKFLRNGLDTDQVMTAVDLALRPSSTAQI